MTKTKRISGYYVTARQSPDGGPSSTAWLVGPFTGPRAHQAAQRMVAAVSHACHQHHSDPRFQFASYGTAKITRDADKPLPIGRLDLTTVVDDVWINYMIAGGYRP